MDYNGGGGHQRPPPQRERSSSGSAEEWETAPAPPRGRALLRGGLTPAPARGGHGAGRQESPYVPDPGASGRRLPAGAVILNVPQQGGGVSQRRLLVPVAQRQEYEQRFAAANSSPLQHRGAQQPGTRASPAHASPASFSMAGGSPMHDFGLGQSPSGGGSDDFLWVSPQSATTTTDRLISVSTGRPAPKYKIDGRGNVVSTATGARVDPRVMQNTSAEDFIKNITHWRALGLVRLPQDPNDPQLANIIARNKRCLVAARINDSDEGAIPFIARPDVLKKAGVQMPRSNASPPVVVIVPKPAAKPVELPKGVDASTPLGYFLRYPLRDQKDYPSERQVDTMEFITGKPSVSPQRKSSMTGGFAGLPPLVVSAPGQKSAVGAGPRMASGQGSTQQAQSILGAAPSQQLSAATTRQMARANAGGGTSKSPAMGPKTGMEGPHPSAAARREEKEYRPLDFGTDGRPDLSMMASGGGAVGGDKQAPSGTKAPPSMAAVADARKRRALMESLRNCPPKEYAKHQEATVQAAANCLNLLRLLRVAVAKSINTEFTPEVRSDFQQEAVNIYADLSSAVATLDTPTATGVTIMNSHKLHNQLLLGNPDDTAEEENEVARATALITVADQRNAYLSALTAAMNGVRPVDDWNYDARDPITLHSAFTKNLLYYSPRYREKGILMTVLDEDNVRSTRFEIRYIKDPVARARISRAKQNIELIHSFAPIVRVVVSVVDGSLASVTFLGDTEAATTTDGTPVEESRFEVWRLLSRSANNVMTRPKVTQLRNIPALNHALTFLITFGDALTSNCHVCGKLMKDFLPPTSYVTYSKFAHEVCSPSGRAIF